MISFDDAIEIVTGIARPLGSERVAIAKAHRRVLAEAVIAGVDSPPTNVSSMDGYAVRDADLEKLPARLRVVGESFAGSSNPSRIEAGACLRIFTGAPVPPGADRVVMQEDVRREADVAVIGTAPDSARYIRARGSDFVTGARLLQAGTLLGPRQLVAAAGADIADVSVWRRPGVIIVATGDELAPPGSAAGRPGAIPESVSLGVAAIARDWGATVVDRIHLADDLGVMETAAARALVTADVVIVTGGASVGEKDFARQMFAGQALELLFSKVAIKPGKPVWLGRARGTIVLGLPGNPTSALVTARLLLAPLLAGMSGRDTASALRWRVARLATALTACGDRETFVRARAVEEGVEPLSNQDSGAQATLAEADLLVRRHAGAPAASAGDWVSVLDD